jgi:hypothetical protein
MKGSAVLIKPQVARSGSDRMRMDSPRQAVSSPLGCYHSHLIRCGLSQTALPFASHALRSEPDRATVRISFAVVSARPRYH